MSPQMQADLEKSWRTNITWKKKLSGPHGATIKKFQKHLDDGTPASEITIPMKNGKDPEKVEFITNPDGRFR